MRRCLLDMDGVLTDFVAGACNLYNATNPYLDVKNWGSPMLETLLGIPYDEFVKPMDREFWETLPPTDECCDIVTMLEKTFGCEHICIYTKPVDVPGCFEGKVRWLKRHLPQLANRYMVGQPKEFAAGPNTWLVDDSDDNVKNFFFWGGRVVLVPRPWNKLNNISSRVLEVIRSRLLNDCELPDKLEKE